MATTVDLASNMAQSMQGLSDLMAVMAYIGGIVFAMRGVMSFKAHNENSEAVPLSRPLTMMIISGILLGMPTFLSSSLNTVSGKNPQAVARAIVPAADLSVVASASALPPVATVALGAPKGESITPTERPPKTRDPASADLLAMIEALGGVGLLALGGWSMLLSSARKSKAQREAKIDLGLLRSKSLGEGPR